MGRPAGWMHKLTGRGAMRSPGAPSLRREVERQFWEQIVTGITSEKAAEAVGVSQPVGTRWFRHRGGMPLFMSDPISGRYLSFAEREEIALLRAQDVGVRDTVHDAFARVRVPASSTGQSSRVVAAVRTMMPASTRRACAWLLGWEERKLGEASHSDRQRFVEALYRIEPSIAATCGLAQRFLGLVRHHDLEGFDRWPGWLSRMGEAELRRSMSRKGCSPDNAACEGFFGRLKTELFYPRNWRSTTIEQFIEVLDSYIRWYNAERIKISLGARSPIEYRQSLGLVA